MQPSLFRIWHLRQLDFGIYFRIEDSPNNATSLRSSTSRRLFASLPRTPPSSCLQCAELTFDNPHFVTPHDLVSFLQKFSRCCYLRLTNVAWSAQADFASDLLVARDLLLIPPFSNIDVEVHCSAYAAETAWLAFSTILRGRSTQALTATSASEYDGYDEEEHRPTLEVLSSAQRAIFDICNFSTGVFTAGITVNLLNDTRAGESAIRSVEVLTPADDENSSVIQLAFYGTQAVIPVTIVRDYVVVIDSISVLSARIYSQPTTKLPSNVGHPSNELSSHAADPWPEIVGLCAAQPGFMRLQLEFDSHDHLVQVMEAQRAALGKLDGRIALFYLNEEKSSRKLRAADFETLADLG
ncbi:hypothetical protein BC629DRAFT_1501578, partial [Irpex lacteus]